MIIVFVIREVRLTLGGKWNSISLGSRARATHSFRRMASSSWFENLRAGPGSKWRLRLPNLYRVAAMPAVSMPPVTRSKGFHVLSSILSLTFINLAHVRAAIACGWKLGLPPSSNSSRLNISTSVRCADCSVRDLWEGFCARDDEDAILRHCRCISESTSSHDRRGRCHRPRCIFIVCHRAETRVPATRLPIKMACYI